MSAFKIAAAQVASSRGDIDGNLAVHMAAIEAAAARGISVVIFPELSLTGYEPDLAASLALVSTDQRLARLQALARRSQMDLVVGAPLNLGKDKPALGAIVLTSDGAIGTYSKMHLGSGERDFFTPGATPLSLKSNGQTIGISICADSAQPSHPQACADGGATVYAASMFLNAEWYESDMPRMAGYAALHGMLVVMANHAASIGYHISVGRSAVWTPGGELLTQANGTENALIAAELVGDRWRGEIVRL